MGDQVAPQRIQAYLPVVEGVERTPPAGAVRAVQVPVGDCGAVADGAQWGNGGPAFGPGVLIAAWGAWAAGSQVPLDQEDGRAGGVGGPAAVAGTVATDMMYRAVQANEVAGTIDGDREAEAGKRQSLAEDTAGLGEEVADHGSPSPQ